MSRVPIEVRQDPDLMRPSDMPDIVCDTTRIRQLTGWQATIPFEQSLQDILSYWRREKGSAGS
jgi:GDP-4-dehydro-6-deoxy-D-mannose reductase